MINSLLLYPYLSLLIAGLIIPSDGNHGIFNPKSFSFLATSIFLVLNLSLKNHIKFNQIKNIFFFQIFISFLIIWFFISTNYHHNFESQYDQFKIFIITISFVIFTFYIVDEKIHSSEKIFKTIIYANFFYSVCKIFFVALHLLNIANIYKLLEGIGIRFMSTEIYGGLERLQTSSDIITPFLFFFVLQSNRLKISLTKSFKNTYFIISILAIFLSFSRFLILIGFVSLFLYWITLNRSRIIKIFIIFLLIVSVSVFFIGFDVVGTIIERRFFSEEVHLSDQIRSDQIAALLEGYYYSPILGHGLGAYVEGYVRDGKLLHAYEVQWVAFLYQFGLIGIFFLMLPIAIISWQIIRPPINKVKTAFLILFFLWILSGFTNPFLISLTSGIVYSLFLLAARQLNDTKFITSDKVKVECRNKL